MSEKYTPFELESILLYEKIPIKLLQEKHTQIKMKNFA